MSPLVLPPGRVAELKSHLMLVYTGIARTAADIAKSYVPGIESRRRQLRIIKQMVDEAIEILTGGINLAAFGELLHESWLAKRSLSELVSNNEIDQLVRTRPGSGGDRRQADRRGGGGFLLLVRTAGTSAGRSGGAGQLRPCPVRVRVRRQPDHLLRAGG